MFCAEQEKLEIKKDKKGMVVVMGSEVKEARNSKELFALFDQGTQNRHTASTSEFPTSDHTLHADVSLGSLVQR